MVRVKEVEISLRPAWMRFSLLLLVGVLLVWMVLDLPARVRGAKLANLIGEPHSLEAALVYDPTRAEAHTRLGFGYLYDPFLFDPAKAVHHFEMAVQLEPFDSTAWSNLARAYEQQGDEGRADRAFNIGIELAPNHFSPRWAYANSLFRRGEMERALSEFRGASEVNPEAIDSICDLIWQTSGGDADMLARFASRVRSTRIQQSICFFLASQGGYQQALDIWKMLPRDDPSQPDASHTLVRLLIRAGQWPQAHLVWLELVKSISGPLSPTHLAFWNGDFESHAAVGGFDWRLKSTRAVEVRLDGSEHYRGSRSLMLEFKEHQNVSFSSVNHDLWVEPLTGYRLQFYYKTKGVPETNGLVVTLYDAEAPTRFRVQSEPLGNQRQWARGEIVFQTPEETRTLTLRIARNQTGRIYDYIEGKVWFDSFSLEPLPRGEFEAETSENVEE